MTPFEVWHGKKPAVHHLKVFGCIAYVLNTTPHLKKLEDRGRKMIFIGYEYGSKAYRAYDPTARRVHVTRDVVFDENAQWDWGSGAKQGDAGSHDDMFTLEYAVGNQVPPELDGAIEVLDDDAPGPEPMSPPSLPPVPPPSVTSAACIATDHHLTFIHRRHLPPPPPPFHRTPSPTPPSPSTAAVPPSALSHLLLPECG
ncbi:unnamed protein product [Spirodela intermedia]|uniref:Retroviral polymerase SH3-like domain-containing protein n=1 Tax=Spirodela intermedia TaxID=51605 RepID=A0A7I8JRH0_SPIIN|nr:unnamed protein product [Spirodela intermedia]CAA6672766.1 unnamed protein product [Spirodela intermedia]